MVRATNWTIFIKNKGSIGLCMSDKGNFSGIIKGIARKMAETKFCSRRKVAKYKRPIVNSDLTSLYVFQ